MAILSPCPVNVQSVNTATAIILPDFISCRNFPRIVRRQTIRCMKRGRINPPMHSTKARPKARNEYMKRKYAHVGASPLTCRSFLNSGRILVERRVALMLRCPASEGWKGMSASIRCLTLPISSSNYGLPSLRRTSIFYHIPFTWRKWVFPGFANRAYACNLHGTQAPRSHCRNSP